MLLPFYLDGGLELVYYRAARDLLALVLSKFLVPFLKDLDLLFVAGPFPDKPDVFLLGVCKISVSLHHALEG